MHASRKLIGLLHFTAPPVVGGVESILGHHARLLDETGHQVRIIAGRGGEHFTHIQFAYVPLADSRHPDVLAVKAALDEGDVPEAFDHLVVQVEAELARVIRDVDILIAHNVCSLHKNLALTAALRKLCGHTDGPRLIMWHHDLAWTSGRYQDDLHEGWPWNLIKEDWPEVHPVHVAVSELRRRELAKLLRIPADGIHVVPSGLATEHFFKLEPLTSELIQRTRFEEAEPRLILPVRITRRKNLELAVRTVAAMSQIEPRTGLIITGPPGPHNPDNHTYLDELRRLRERLGVVDQVHFLAEIVSEYLPDVVIADLYRVADALFLPSREEGFGIPMLEAALVGLPIFCADIPALREIASSNAFFFSPEIAADDLGRLILKELGENSAYLLRQRIRRDYTWSGVFAQRIAPLLELL